MITWLNITYIMMELQSKFFYILQVDNSIRSKMNEMLILNMNCSEQ